MSQRTWTDIVEAEGVEIFAAAARAIEAGWPPADTLVLVPNFNDAEVRAMRAFRDAPPDRHAFAFRRSELGSTLELMGLGEAPPAPAGHVAVLALDTAATGRLAHLKPGEPQPVVFGGEA